MDSNFDEDFAAISRAAARLGMPSADGIDVSELESADEFLARMKSQQPMPQRRRVWRQVAFGGAVAASTAAIATVITVIGHDQPATADTPPMLDYAFADPSDVATSRGRPAQDALGKLAALARGDRPARTSGTQEIVSTGWFAHLDTAATPGSARLIPTVQTSRLAPDGTLVVESRQGRSLSIDGRVAKGVSVDPETREVIPPGTFDPNRARDLGADPAKIRSELLTHAGCETSQGPQATACLFREIVSLSNQWVIPPEVAGAMWDMLAAEPSVRSLGPVDDRAGRPGVAFVSDSDGPPSVRTVLIIGSSDGKLLGSEVILTKDDPNTGVEAPAVYSFTTILTSHWIDQT